MSRYSPDVLLHLIALNAKWIRANEEKATVTIEDIEGSTDGIRD